MPPPSSHTIANSSHLFEPYRAIGIVCDAHAKSIVKRWGDTKTFLTAAAGRSFIVYDTDKLRVAIASRTVPINANIQCLAVPDADTTFVAAGNRIFRFKRAATREEDDLATADFVGHPGNVRAMLSFGKEVVCSIDESGSLITWDATARPARIATRCELGSEFAPRALLHPKTYLNKVLVAGRHSLQLWNIRTGTLTHSFKSIVGGRKKSANEEEDDDATTSSTTIETVELAPVLDVVAVGYSNGVISMVNLKHDCELLRLTDVNRRVTALAFGSTRDDVLVTGNSSGEILVWNLNEQRMVSKFNSSSSSSSSSNAGGGGFPVVAIHALPGEDAFMVHGGDNALRTYRFSEDFTALQLVRSRQGHASAPTRVRYHPTGFTVATLSSGSDARVCQILSASATDRTLRVFHAALDHQTKEFSEKPAKTLLRSLRGSEANANLAMGEARGSRLAPIVAFATREARPEHDWCDVVTVHAEDPFPKAWNFDRGVLMGELIGDAKRGFDRENPHRRRAKRAFNADPRDVSAPATASCISACGNFALVGNARGLVLKYNLQSGIPRGCYPRQSWRIPGAEDDERRKRAKKKRHAMLPASSVHLITAADEGEDSSHARTSSQRKMNEVFHASKAASEAVDEEPRHAGPVTVIASDALDRCLYTGGLDGKVRVWDFATHALLDTCELGSPIAMGESSRDGGFLALACDDGGVRIYDKSTRRVVRHFRGGGGGSAAAHAARVTDLAFSPDARWLASGSLDGTVRVWDVVSGSCLDWIRFASPPSSLAFSPAGDFLATAHVDFNGICLWANRAFFLGESGALASSSSSSSSKEIGGAARRDEPVNLAMPYDLDNQRGTTKDEGGDDDDDEEEIEFELRFSSSATSSTRNRKPDDDTATEETGATFPPPPLNPMIETSGVGSASRWYALSHIELIKERNRPLQPPEKPKSAPFFIPTQASELDALLKTNSKSSSVSGKSLPTSSRILVPVREEEEDDDAARTSSPVAPLTGITASPLLSHLHHHHYPEFVVALGAMSASAIDYEIRSSCVGPEDPNGLRVLGDWLAWIAHELRNERNFEAVQAVLGRLLAVHGETIVAHRGLREALSEVEMLQHTAWGRLDAKFKKAACLIELYARMV